VFGLLKMGSILGGIVAVVVGLPLSAVVVFTLLGVIDRKDQRRTGDSHGQH
jgi:fructose-specific phosphotransferase system IIC component